MEDQNTIFKALELIEMTSYREVFSSSESGLLLALIHHWNRSGRPEAFRLWNSQLYALSGLRTDKTIQSARDKLIRKGILFSDKSGNRGERSYSFNALFSLPSPLQVKDTSKRQVNGKLMESKRQVNGESPQEKEKEKEKDTCPQADVLEKIWKQAPSRSRSRSSKKLLKTAWLKIPPSKRPDQETILSALEAWKGSPDWIKDGGQYIQGIHLWIKQERWENAPTSPETPAVQSSSPRDWQETHRQLFPDLAVPTQWEDVASHRKEAIRRHG